MSMILFPSSIDEIKQFKFANRQDAIDTLQMYHARLNPPKKLKKVVETCGTHATYCCIDEDCPVRVSVKQITKNYQKSWVVFNRENYPETWIHGSLCEAIVSLSNKTAAYLLKDVESRGRDLIMKAREHGIHLGGDEALASDLKSRHFKAAARLRQYMSLIQNEQMDESIPQLPEILRAYTDANEGSYADYQTINNLLTRCVIVSQISISMYQHGFLRRLFAIDCGFWKNTTGKCYKLLLVESTTGNNENCCVAFAIVDGETTDNVDWVLDRLKVAGVDLNKTDIATISDEGKALLKATLYLYPFICFVLNTGSAIIQGSGSVQGIKTIYSGKSLDSISAKAKCKPLKGCSNVENTNVGNELYPI